MEEQAIKQVNKYDETIERIHKVIQVIKEKTFKIRIVETEDELEAVPSQKKTEVQSDLDNILYKLQDLVEEIQI